MLIALLGMYSPLLVMGAILPERSADEHAQQCHYVPWSTITQTLHRSLCMPITLDGSSLTIEKLVAIARNAERVELAPAALERIKACRRMLEQKLAAREIMYGTNTGIGEFSEKVLSDDQVKDFQKYLIYN